MDIEALRQRLRSFAHERDWEQFHTPKNLAMALAGEAGELLEIFQWLTSDESQKVMKDGRRAQQVRDELADVLNYLIRLADVVEVDLEQALLDKIESNEEKYPVDKAKGSAAKYTEYEQ